MSAVEEQYPFVPNKPLSPIFHEGIDLFPKELPTGSQLYEYETRAFVATEAQQGSEWLSRVEVDSVLLKECDLADRVGVIELEDYLKDKNNGDPDTAQNAHQTFGEAYNNHRRHREHSKPSGERTTMSAAVALSRLQDGTIFLTVRYQVPLDQEDLSALRPKRQPPKTPEEEGARFDKLLFGSGANDEAALESAELIDIIGDGGRGLGILDIFTDASGVVRERRPDNSVGLCEWYVIKDGRDTAMQEAAVEHFHVAGKH